MKQSTEKLDSASIKRRDFLKSLAGGVILASTMGSLLAACGDDSPSAPNVPVAPEQPGEAALGDCNANGTDIDIGDNHGHQLEVPIEDIAAGAEKSYDITGIATHPHTVTLSAENFQQLSQNPNQSVRVPSTLDNGHTHLITVSCATAPRVNT